MAHNNARNIRTKKSSFELINNVFYDFKFAAGFSSGQDWTAIGNHWKKGVTSIRSNDITSYITDDAHGHTGSIYHSNNTNDFDVKFLRSEWESYVVGSPPLNSGIVPKSVSESISYILENAGARHPYFDPVDQRVIQDYYANSGKVIDSQMEVGGYPELDRGTPLMDSDDDGMPDAWEESMGLDLSADDSAGDHDSDGYTNIEEYLYSFTF